ncbi:MAG: cobalamin-independent methionine synthase II family protein [Candidatus Dormibacteraeota bacterium]|nr:cobalamin-independent methionine synthase II family protein [Candidatus Dormibacteraeota bacterium]MBO0761308.1 cobalamin-independent methionine synthase II family protein [Candidatus Dormibacteraeota bacterium]
MQSSSERIRVTHQGTLPREPELTQLVSAAEAGQAQATAVAPRVESAVSQVVRRQLEIGIDIVNDGEQSKSNFAYYVERRLGSHPQLEEEPDGAMSTRDRLAFPGFFSRGEGVAKWRRHYAVREPVRYTGQALVQADVENLKSALSGASGDVEGVLMSIAPGTIEHWLHNDHYPSQEEFLFAIADAMHEEYRTITDAGFIVQIDDPDLATGWQMYPDQTVAEYRKYAQLRVDALNRALRGIPPEQVILHVCWGSYHTPHVNDLPLRDIVDLFFAVNAQGISIEQSNPRHEHEWAVFDDVELPEGKLLIPGVVGHVADVVEHPELVAQRLVRYAERVGREHVIAGTDCGVGSRVGHGEVAWAKLEALVEGARLASKRLWS